MVPIQTVFLDRDGVINRKAPEGEYVTCWEDFEFLPGAIEALRLLTEAGKRIVLVTNQRCIARGMLTEDGLQELHHRMLREAAPARIDAMYHCPHEYDACDCRKPYPGLLLQAKRDLPDIEFESSVMVGDSESDVVAGHRAGCQTVLISETPAEGSIATFHAPSLLEATRRYLL
jgi:D-glycero-D-manno-heptose 1,7-bisphosphate phosphatase